MWQIESQIRYIQAKISGNSGAITKICNADVAGLGFKVRFHELIEVPFSAGCCCGLCDYIPAAARKSSALSVFSQVKAASSRPKWPYAAVA